MKTPVVKCETLASYAQTILNKFPQNPALTAVAQKLGAAATALAAAQAAYVAAVRDIVTTRAEVKWNDHTSDDGVRKVQRDAESADGHKGGRIASAILPNGITPIVKPVGSTQCQAMRDLEGRLEAMTASWPGASAAYQHIASLRSEYEAALAARQAAVQKASNLRAARDLAKEDFLDVYAEATARVKAEFPRNRRMQELFFDKVWDTDAAEQSAEEEAEEPTGEGSGQGG
ncbi:hypothetical protein [Polyangium aurulentum]|uniref:hypothetical protein n=1 Tax=Polyangium aurulentum TaxID=2567896 RepID=UPI0010AEE82D|nr:hypothetical protein [Polyangium aurulentum]UQA55928.1 hypothetical protein E8A73_031975 [Polyangium aurulentum]